MGTRLKSGLLPALHLEPPPRLIQRASIRAVRRAGGRLGAVHDSSNIIHRSIRYCGAHRVAGRPLLFLTSEHGRMRRSLGPQSSRRKALARSGCFRLISASLWGNCGLSQGVRRPTFHGRVVATFQGSLSTLYVSFFFKCDIPVVFYNFNMYSVQLAVKTQLIYCTVCTMYKNYMFWPSSGFSYSLESEVSYGQIYHIEDEISFTLYKLLLRRDY